MSSAWDAAKVISLELLRLSPRQRRLLLIAVDMLLLHLSVYLSYWFVNDHSYLSNTSNTYCGSFSRFG